MGRTIYKLDFETEEWTETLVEELEVGDAICMNEANGTVVTDDKGFDGLWIVTSGPFRGEKGEMTVCIEEVNFETLGLIIAAEKEEEKI